MALEVFSEKKITLPVESADMVAVSKMNGISSIQQAGALLSPSGRGGTKSFQSTMKAVFPTLKTH